MRAMKWSRFIQTVLSSLVCVSYIENTDVWKITKVPVLTQLRLRLVWHFHEMFLLLIGKKLAEKQSYDSFKCICTEYFGLYYIYVHVQAIPTYRVYWFYDTGIAATVEFEHDHNRSLPRPNICGCGHVYKRISLIKRILPFHLPL